MDLKVPFTNNEDAGHQDDQDNAKKNDSFPSEKGAEIFCTFENIFQRFASEGPRS